MPVIPVAVVGTDVVAPPGKKFGSLTRPLVRFGKPLDFSRYEGLENDRFILRSITDEIMYEIMRLSGQEYVDMYATRAKALDKESKKPSARGRCRRPRGRRPIRPTRDAQSLLTMTRLLARAGLLDPASEQVDTTLLRALAVLRFVVAVYAVALNVARWREFAHPVAGWVVIGVIVVWTFVATWAYEAPRRRGLPLLVARPLGGRRDAAVHAVRAERRDARTARVDDAVVLGDGAGARLGRAPGLARRHRGGRADVAARPLGAHPASPVPPGATSSCCCSRPGSWATPPV